MKKPHYRPDIDGLRALAVIPVILFHLNLVGFSGGYIGVDVFFVISGYLITSILVRSFDTGSFSFIQFWERRARRILPALATVLLTTTVASYFIILFPPDFVDFGQSLAAQSVFLINIFFMRVADYFAAPAETMPLLHTWSLAVEEQFYIGFPILLFVIFYFAKRYLIPTLLVATVCSFAYSVYLVNINPNAAFSFPFLPHVWGGATNASAGFYLPLARAWELFAGALLAVTAWQIINRQNSELLAIAGLAAIVLPIVLLTDSSAFPGLAALAPVLGTCALIMANKQHRTFVGQVLSHPVLVWVGLISYSLYLWHWPLIVLAKQFLNGPLQTVHINGIIIATFVLAAATYYFVETPFRTRQLLPKTWQIFTFAIVSIIFLGSVGVYITKENGLPLRATEAAQEVAIANADRNPREYECFRNSFQQIFGKSSPCIIGDMSSALSPSYVLWGDSHANATMPAFEAAGRETRRQGAMFATGGCPPLITNTPFNKDPQCTTQNQKAIDYIAEHNIPTVFIVASWLNEYPHQDRSGTTTAYEALKNTINALPTTTQVIFTYRIPGQPDFDVRALFYEAIETNVAPSSHVTKEDYINDTASSRDAIKQLAMEKSNVSYIDSTSIFCPLTTCSILNDNYIIYTDGNHLNATGALLLTPLITPYLKN